jgi:hypothetical protein
MRASVDYLRKSEGWELGTGPTFVLLDKSFAKTLSTTTMQKGVYAFVFNQQGLMAGIGIKGAKSSQIHLSAPGGDAICLATSLTSLEAQDSEIAAIWSQEKLPEGRVQHKKFHL